MRKRLCAALSVILFAALPALAQPEAKGTPGNVYAMTNAEDGNIVLAYDRLPNGTLSFAAAYSTGGNGFVGGTPVDPLRSQGSLILSQDHRWLLAVNAGSDEISVFRVKPRGLTRTDLVHSEGVFPVSVTVHRNLVYVLNAGGSAGDVDNITGFTLSPHGLLTPLAGSTRMLSAPSTDPAQVEFTPDGSMLVVTEKATNSIGVFQLDTDGLPSATPVLTPSAGDVPFGFIFNRRGRLLVSEAAGRSVSSYVVNPDATLRTVSAAVPTGGQVATCWIAGNGGRYAFTANTGSDTLSSFSVASSGVLALLEAIAADVPDAAPIDLDVTRSGRFLYTVNAVAGAIGMFRVEPDATLAPLGEALGLPVNDGAQGIAVR
jgi:6-phosphogluconolactonase (cycloisomerase 2 family)